MNNEYYKPYTMPAYYTWIKSYKESNLAWITRTTESELTKATITKLSLIALIL